MVSSILNLFLIKKIFFLVILLPVYSLFRFKSVCLCMCVGFGSLEVPKDGHLAFPLTLKEPGQPSTKEFPGCQEVKDPSIDVLFWSSLRKRGLAGPVATESETEGRRKTPFPVLLHLPRKVAPVGRPCQRLMSIPAAQLPSLEDL